jgi:hypothetical protein
MGIKNIHIFLISASALMAALFGLWSFKNAEPLWAGIAVVVALALVGYGISFVNKAKKL